VIVYVSAGPTAISSDHQTVLGESLGDRGSLGWWRWYGVPLTETYQPFRVFSRVLSPQTAISLMGSIAMDSSQDIALGNRISSPSMYPSINYTGRLPSDTPGISGKRGSRSSLARAHRLHLHAGGDDTACDRRRGRLHILVHEPIYNGYRPVSTETRLASFKFPSCGSTTVTSPCRRPRHRIGDQGQCDTYTVTLTPLRRIHVNCSINQASVSAIRASARLQSGFVMASGNLHYGRNP